MQRLASECIALPTATRTVSKPHLWLLSMMETSWFTYCLNFRVRSWIVVSDSSIFLASSNVAKNSRHSGCDLKEGQHVLPVNSVSSARSRGVNKRPTIAVRNSGSVLLSLWILVVVAFINIPRGSTTTLDCLRVRIEGENV